MTDAARRVVLLARPGTARDRLRAALADAGAQLVLEADPTVLASDELLAAAPQVVVVALDAATEDALDRFDPVLHADGVEVLFEEAELAARREGWEAARWVRHLAAKLHGHGDVLPPGHEPEDAPVPEPAAPAAAEPGDASAVAPAAGHAVPAEPTFAVPAASADAPAADAGHAFDPVLAEFDDAPPAFAQETPLEPFAPEWDLSEPAPEPAVEIADARPRLEPVDLRFDQPPALPGDAPAAQDPVLLFAASQPPQPPAPAAPPPAPDWSFADEVEPVGDAASGDDRRFHHDLLEIERRIAGLELVDDRPAPARQGAVLVLAGIGGPDAVRQLLGALPADFPQTVLVQQRLDGGRYDRLVAQMQRVTPLPVQLAEAGRSADRGVVYILPAGLGLRSEGAALRFAEGEADPLDALPGSDSAVLLLSGSDPAQVDAVLRLAGAGALVAGQAPDGCYDAAASTALIARGGESGPPAELAARLAARWKN
ncbi:chemotaxis protein CheB [Vulcaniibacterium tengchongense]|uniref:CheB-type methylesterase domain-containing protein n=1 Tax=Vulcaniibacterium tengchongense TaxID=1273429 RepID=A0A3N4V2J4_9GAMM|nr:chemotaxis protein CheB [Vulcaniibacterium tengchongense]RPE75455.1 chemosensory pili system protein ChpB (putative protein-glutamate methylesterase) [Vulcaniibacterium tengchongense]